MQGPPQVQYAVILAVAAILSMLVVIVAYSRRRAPGAMPLLILMIAATIWAASYALHWLAFPEPRPFFWLDATYFGVVVVPLAFLAFTLQFTGRGAWLSPTRLAFLAVIPVVTVVFLWTDSEFGLFFDGKRQAWTSSYYNGGLWFWVNVFYLYILFAVGVALLLIAYIRSHGLQRGQTGVILLGAVLPWLGNIYTLLGLNPFPNLDPTPILFMITGAIFAYALFRRRLLDLIPVARDRLVERMEDGMLVVDGQGRVVDMNPAARKILMLSSRNTVGKPLVEVCERFPALAGVIQQETFEREEVELVIEGLPHIYELGVTPLYDRREKQRGNLYSFRDITSLKQVEYELRQTNEALQAQITANEQLQVLLREQAIRDPLTGLFNRRYLEETLEREVSRAARSGQPVSLLMIDIDHFKLVNDCYGHRAGDLVLQALGQHLQSMARDEDITCRYGGEEFVWLLPGAPLAVTQQRAVQFQSSYKELVVTSGNDVIRSTVSIGVAAFPEHGASGELLLTAADQALYAAKRAGRDRVVVYRPYPNLSSS